jgi:glutathione synthase/RimK-type ligase-like ATP-grasp enzyme
MAEALIIGVGTDSDGWYKDVLAALDRAREQGVPVRAVTVDLFSHDWVRNAGSVDALIWNPWFMGPVSASFFKEKIYFLQNVAGLRIMPNWESVWHFESKVAQSYLLDSLDVPRPRTIVSFEREDAAAAVQELGLPVVAKKSFGSSGENVLLLRTQRQVDRYLQTEFAQQIWDERKAGSRSAVGAALSGLLSPWLHEKMRRKAVGAERHGYAYFQEFIDGNDSDVRIAVMGRRMAGCVRMNRKNDFRASGSGNFIRGDDLPLDAMRLCADTCSRIGADTLAFDVLYRDGEPLIVEMCYVEDISTSPAHWVEEPDGTLTRIMGEIWDQELWVKHMLDSLGLAGPDRSDAGVPL